MKVIFLKDVPKLGKKDDVKEMNDGYVQNFLLPQKLVQVATPQAMSMLKKRLDDRKAGNDAEDIRNKLCVDSVNNKDIVILAKANEKDALFKSITNKDIVSAVQDQLQINITENLLENDLHFKNIGNYVVNIKAGNHNGKINLIIKKE